MTTRPSTRKDHRERIGRAIGLVERHLDLQSPGEVAADALETVIALRVL